MTQYYEKEANRLEYLASLTNDHGEQNIFWGEAARIGTPMQYCMNGGMCELNRDGTGCDCD